MSLVEKLINYDKCVTSLTDSQAPCSFYWFKQERNSSGRVNTENKTSYDRAMHLSWKTLGKYWITLW